MRGRPTWSARRSRDEFATCQRSPRANVAGGSAGVAMRMRVRERHLAAHASTDCGVDARVAGCQLLLLQLRVPPDYQHTLCTAAGNNNGRATSPKQPHLCARPQLGPLGTLHAELRAQQGGADAPLGPPTAFTCCTHVSCAVAAA